MNPVSRAFVREHQAGFAVLAAFVCVTIAVVEFASGLARSNRSWLEAERELATLVAEDSAFAECGVARDWPVVRAGMRAETSRIGDQLTIKVVCDHGRSYEFGARVLPGAAPALLARAQGVGLPSFGADAREAIRPGAACPFVVRDESVGLLRIATGTDLVDWRLRLDQDGVVRPRTTEACVARVAGHLWVDRDGKPLTVELDHALTLLVDGNIYLGRSLFVRGNGRLTLVARGCPGLRFHDLDGDGRKSEGDELFDDHPTVATPIEGSGSIYLGLPDHGDANHRIECDAGLWAEGDVVVVEALAIAHSCVLAGLGHRVIGPGARLESEPTWPMLSEREWVPGFVPTGGPRPGPLVRR